MDDLWTPDLVKDALVDAYKLCDRIVGRVGPRGYAPQWVREVGAEELETGEKARMVDDGTLAEYERALAAERNRFVLGASMEDIRRAELAITWVASYLKLDEDNPYAQPITVLNLYVRCKVRRWKFIEALRRRGIAERTGRHYRDKALAQIAIGLNRDEVPVWRVR